MSYQFKGGVHPNYMKSPEIPATVIAPPKQVIIPMAQHIGAPCKPLVQVGDYVKMYQKIGENPAPVSAPVHASVSGKVVAIEPRPHPLGDLIPAVVIENDFHKSKELRPNVCALFVEPAYRKQGLARLLLDHACEKLAEHGITTAYLCTDHTDFYERCGWSFHCMVEEDSGGTCRLYKHEM